MTDAVTGQFRGDGFVRFAEEGDQQPALAEMQGVYCGNHLCAPRPQLRRLEVIAIHNFKLYGNAGMIQAPPMQQGGMN